ncbi:MAG TPA: M56 family metallopeptidase [Patescibacteria group bacterium]
MTALSFLKRNLLFGLISLTLSVYLVFLFIFFRESYPGFIMQLIFLLDALLHHPQGLVSLLSGRIFLFNIFSGIILLYCLYRFFKALFGVCYKISTTHRFLSTLDLSPSLGYSLIHSSRSLAFTAGYLHPRIYISSDFQKHLSETEMRAVYYHEYAHALMFDPLRDLFIGFSQQLLPDFPFKNWLFQHYSTVVEISCDNYSVSRLSLKKPLVSALYKAVQIDSAGLSLGFPGFSSQHQRLEVLVGTKREPVLKIFAYNLVLLFSLLIISSSLFRFDPFYSCSHLIQCLQLVFTPAGESSIKPSASFIRYSTVSDHCLSN